MATGSVPRKTIAGFKIRGIPKPIRTFDDSDLSEMNGVDTASSSVSVDKAVTLPRTVPNHLLMISVLEQLCMMYEKDDTAARELFKLLSEQLVAMRVVSPLTSLDELSGMRDQYRFHVHKMIQAASDTVHKRHMLRPALPAPMKKLSDNFEGWSPFINGVSPELPFVRFEDVVSSNTSRYRQEFVEVDQLGRGGFGSVFRARNKLDGRQYAVKKIKFRHASPNVLLKVLREVKALASLQHPNIIGYNGAWLEYEKPTFNSLCNLPRLVHSEESNSSYNSKSGISNIDDSEIVFEEDDKHEVVEFQVNSYGFGPQDDVQFLCTEDSLKISNCVSKNDHLSKNNCLAFPNNDIDSFTTSHNSVSEVESLHKKEFKKGDNSSSDISILDVKKGDNSTSDISIMDEDKDQKGDNSTSDISILDEDKDPSHVFDLSVSDNQPVAHLQRHSMEEARSSDKYRSIVPKTNHVIWKRSISYDPVVLGDLNSSEYTDENFLIEMTVTLFIQMELCSHTLQEWLADRNQSPKHHSGSVINVQENLQIFQQLVSGVEYIHSQGVIHRDLKPRNIFLNGSSLHVKIGDFGLARESLAGDMTETILSPPANLKAYKFFEDPTLGVGTSTYAAPEQLSGSLYDNKCDMYSLGVILYEMFEEFQTEMERHEKLKVLRDSDLPQDFKIKWPQQAQTIDALTSFDPALRPSAQDLLASEMFKSKTQLIQDLRRTVNDQEVELVRLRLLLQEKDQEIIRLKGAKT